MPDPLTDELDEEDHAAIEESEEQIAQGRELDWVVVSRELRKRYPCEPPPH
jgi:hypothetical protein